MFKSLHNVMKTQKIDEKSHYFLLKKIEKSHKSGYF